MAGKTPEKRGENDPKEQSINEPPILHSTDKTERYSVKPEFWDQLLDSIPPWGDEILGIVLLVFGFVSFLAIFNTTDNTPLARAWSDSLRNLFGYGAIIVSVSIFLLGFVIFLPKFGIEVKISFRRILALEVMFLCLLALLHLLTGDPELRAVARAGEGGGIIGGALSAMISGLLGTTTAIVFFSVILLIALGVALGLRRSQIADWLTSASNQLKHYSNRTMLDTQRTLGTVTRATYVTDTRSPVHTLMRIRPDPSNLPPSKRGDLFPPPPIGLEEPKEENLSEEELALFSGTRQYKENDYDTVGKILNKKGSHGDHLAERPDGRIKRYFSVGKFEEAKKTKRREKSLPSIELLEDHEIFLPEEEEINKNVVLIENTLLEFDINIDVVDVRIGPTVTQYAVQPYADGTGTSSGRIRLSKIASYSNDLSLALSAKRLRMEIPVPGHSYMGIEVPNKTPSTVSLRSVYESKTYFEKSQKNKSPLYIPLGRDVAGQPVGLDVGGCPHLLIAGTTGSGKSVAIAAIATSLILENTPDKVKMVMLDPKMVELSRFNGIPHLIGPVETDLERIIGVLRWCTREMDRRYKVLEEHAARNINDYNARLGTRRRAEYMPYIVILVDEVGDLMMSKPEETEHAITRLAQMARAVGMHMVIATQRPSTDVITGLIKANFPTRIAFSVASGVDSRVILDTIGAETLLGKGDMLYLAQDASGPQRLQGCFVGDEEVRKVVDHWRQWQAERIEAGKYKPDRVAPWERGLTRREFLAETDPMLEDAIELVIREQEASASLIQRRLGLGYPRAARIMDLLEELGIIGESVAGGRNRKVLIEKGKDPFKDIVDKKTRES